MEDLKWPCWLKINPRGFTSADGEGLGKGTLELSFFKADDDCSWLLRPSQRSWPGGLTNQDKVASIWGLQAMFPSIFNNCKIKFIAMVAVCETLTTCPACCQARYSMYIVISVQFGLSCVWLFNAMDCSMPGFPVHHQLPELAQIHVHRVGDAIQSSHPLVPFSSRLQSFPASGSFQMSQFFISGGQSTGVSASASVLPMNTQDWSPLGWTGWISLQSKGLSRVFSNTTVQKHPFFSAQLSL